MEISYKDLRERYRNATTDELLQIKISDDLTDTAKSLLEEELSTRKVTQEDILYANDVEKVLRADRESVKKDMSHRVRRFLIILVLVAMMAIYFELLR